jgi:tetratricopeptide (TPR) repeat protein
LKLSTDLSRVAYTLCRLQYTLPLQMEKNRGPQNRRTALPEARQTRNEHRRLWGITMVRMQTEDQGPSQLDFNQLADRLITGGQWAAAISLLERAIRDMPKDWKPVQSDPNIFHALIGAFWDREEFIAYARAKNSEGYLITWIERSYSKAWYQLALIAVEEGNLTHALRCVGSGLTLEPDHPHLWSEKGYILSRQGNHEAALGSYEVATTIRHWASPPQLARALRGRGATLIDLKRLDDAEEAFKRSLVLDPDSKVAMNELEYIAQLRAAAAADNI